jgi:putative ABC transport system permease protein
MRRAVAVIVRSGLSTRPAISQPRPTDATAAMPSAIPDSMSNWSSVSVRSPANAWPTRTWQVFSCAGDGGDPSAVGSHAATTPAPSSLPPRPGTTPRTAASAAAARCVFPLVSSRIGTDVTVTTKPKPPSATPVGGNATSGGPGGGPRAEICLNGKCYTSGTVDTLVLGDTGALSQSEVAQIAGLHDVLAAAGGLMLTDNRVTLPSASNPNLQPPTSFTVDGTDISHPRLGLLSNARLTSGRAFTAADDNSYAALVDTDYASSHDIKVGSTTTIGGTKFKVIGLVSQSQASSPPNMYIPLARAQALATDPGTGKSMSGKIDTVYVTASGASDITAVQQEIQHLLPQATVTSSADLASEITGSAASAAKLAGALGTWLAVLVLIAAFAVASLLTMAAVARRVPEFGTLKALGWRSGRIVTQVLGESLTTGILGGLAGVGLGFAGVAIIDKIAPKLSATIPSASGGVRHPADRDRAGRVLLADEPTGNLDEDTRDEIIALLDTLWRERRLTLVLVSHDGSVVRRAQRIGVMSRGRLSIRQDTRA